jgi:NAD(P)-dependent dehydrogenase (short-subunit alcohol dehydrogenase family)
MGGMVCGLDPMGLNDKSLVIIGGTAGIGLSAARAFIAAGARVVVVGRNDEHLEPARAALSDSARVFGGDATDPGTAPRAIGEALAAFGRFDGLYHVAGGSGRRWGDGPLHELTDDGWRATVELNLTSVFYSNRAAVRQFLAGQHGGSVLNLGSVLAFSPSPRHFATHAYAASKSALIGFTRSCAACYAANNIRFNVLAPGLVDTPMSRRAAADPEIGRFVQSKQPLAGGRIGQPTDLDGAAMFFLSDASAFTTGQVLAVDGGWTLSEGASAPPPSS